MTQQGQMSPVTINLGTKVLGISEEMPKIYFQPTVFHFIFLFPAGFKCKTFFISRNFQPSPFGIYFFKTLRIVKPKAQLGSY